MSQHSQSFEAEREIAPDKVQQLLPKPVQAAPAPLQAQASRGKFKQVLLAGAAAVVLAAAGWYGWDYWTVGRFLVSTDDAYVKADNTTIAPKVSGYLRDVLVGDNERVAAGQVLAKIDDRDFKVALDQAKADVAAAEAAVASKRAQLEVQQAVIEAAKATLDVDTAAKTFAEQENKRYTDLATTGYGSVQNAQQAQSRHAGAQAAVQRDVANLVSAQKQVELLKADITQAIAAAARARAIQAQAELNLGYTTITAPIDGVVGNRTLRVGQFVQAGTQLMSLVPATGAYVVANFKETQLTDVHKGQKVDIAIDMFPGQIVHGHVEFARARQRPGIRAAAAGQRHRQFHQGGAAHPRQDRARQHLDRAAPGHVGDSHHRDAVTSGRCACSGGEAERRLPGCREVMPCRTSLSRPPRP